MDAGLAVGYGEIRRKLSGVFRMSAAVAAWNSSEGEDSKKGDDLRMPHVLIILSGSGWRKAGQTPTARGSRAR
jgi:hypothetical protein